MFKIQQKAPECFQGRIHALQIQGKPDACCVNEITFCSVILGLDKKYINN
jgi:hypothetical protein